VNRIQGVLSLGVKRLGLQNV